MSDTSPQPIKINPEQKKLLDEISKSDQANLKAWEAKLKEAQTQVDYWKRTCEHSSALAMRATMQQW